MFIGVMYGLGACALWGMTYLLPVLLPQYDSMYIAISRALVMGLVSLILILIFVDKFRQLTRNDWIFSIKLTLIGNLIQAWFLMMQVSRLLVYALVQFPFWLLLFQMRELDEKVRILFI